MSELYEKSLLKLELDQVLEQLARCAGSEGGKEACRKLRPVSDLEDVQRMLDETTAASNLCTRKGNPVRKLRPVSDLEDVQRMLDETTAASNLCTRKGNPVFADVTDMSASLERADRGGCLQPMELLRIAGILRCARTIQGTRKGNPVFADVTDMSASLERADRGGCLQPMELLRIAGILRCARTIQGYIAEDEEKTVLDGQTGAAAYSPWSCCGSPESCGAPGPSRATLPRMRKRPCWTACFTA